MDSGSGVGGAPAWRIASDSHQSLSQTVATLIRRGTNSGSPGEVALSTRTGPPIVRLGRTKYVTR